MIVSKLTTKAQTTIPRAVRIALGLDPGDELIYEIDGARVVLTKARPGAVADDPFRTFREWGTKADAEAYADL
ncbi:MAG: AbrB/MazE/SpoVT family DNA-binding domain-containing protein [Acidobacteria bacterium]|nr:AbrB/MazE/SpoVT family DNA-binding domain-containing protein [Chloroflexota bacterium]MYN66403.1 AbrB/MazE/SpoVT family DNA-binding domain-containing protein [Acidobacteriota bacterium]